MTLKETGQDKIEKICDLLRSQALEPAETEAKQIIAAAEKEAQQIIKNAEKTAEDLAKGALARIATEKQAAHIALKEAHKQTLEALKQDIEQKLFAPTLHTMIENETNRAPDLANLINVLAETINKEGFSTDFSAIISKKVDAAQVNQALVSAVASQLKEKGVEMGGIGSGILMKLHDKKMTLDISDQALLELMSKHLRKDFRDKIFAKA